MGCVGFVSLLGTRPMAWSEHVPNVDGFMGPYLNLRGETDTSGAFVRMCSLQLLEPVSPLLSDKNSRIIRILGIACPFGGFRRQNFRGRLALASSACCRFSQSPTSERATH